MSQAVRNSKTCTLRPMTCFLVLLLVASPLFAGTLHDPREEHLAEVRQLTFEGENAEAYWSPDGTELVLQATFGPYACDQIFRLAIDEPGKLQRVSNGEGRTTCGYYTYPKGERILYSSTHAASKECPPRPDYSKGYVWPILSTLEIYSALPDGSDLQRLTENAFYDAEATVCQSDGSILFTSTRDGDLEIYRMKADGSEVQRLTDAPGYDGGAFFSPDCSQIVWRASRPEGEALDDYRSLLAEGLVRPSKLELWIANADGSEAQQITYLDAANFAPYFHPSGKRVLFSSNYGDPSGREFDIWAVDTDGGRLERITYTPGFDGFPMFSPDGSMLAFASNRNQGKPGETDVYVARWVEGEVRSESGLVDRYGEAVAWLADDAREGRGIGTEGLAESARWLAESFAKIGVEPAAEEGYLQPFTVPVRAKSGEGTGLHINGEAVPGESFVIASFSTSDGVEGEVVPVGYGISATEIQHDDYAGVDVEGKIALVRRFTPLGGAFAGEEGSTLRRRYGDLRYKAWNAREHGASGVLIVDWPELPEGEEMPSESPLPGLRVEAQADAGLPAMVLAREVGKALFEGGGQARLAVDLQIENEPTHNVVGRVLAGGERLEGAVLVGAHFDHLGMGGPGSLDPNIEAPHNGADDNASGTAALLEIGRRLVENRESLRRDVYLVGFSGEERGLRGSTHLTREPTPGLSIDNLLAMVNLDMIGRLRNNRVSVLGSDSAPEWAEVLEPLCAERRIGCRLGGDGYGPSDQTPFYAAGVPVVHFFTGAHGDYHRPSDDVGTLNLVGAAHIAGLVGDLMVALGQREQPFTYQAVAAPEPQGDQRSYGASLGTVPDYADDKPGVLLAGTRPGGPAEKAGMLRGDRMVELAGHEVRDIYDFMFVLRQSKPGQTVTAVVERGEERVELEITFGQSVRVLR